MKKDKDCALLGKSMPRTYTTAQPAPKLMYVSDGGWLGLGLCDLRQGGHGSPLKPSLVALYNAAKGSRQRSKGLMI